MDSSSGDKSLGDICWHIDEKHGLQVVKVVEINGQHAKVEPLAGTYTTENTSYEVELITLHHETQALDQLVNLNSFNSPSVVNALYWRLTKGLPYTNCGLFTLAMNPFKAIEGVYGPTVIAKHRKAEEILAPHAYTVVETAYRGMTDHQVDQTILVSGMSGAGKTETVKICINYLSSIEGGKLHLEKQINEAGLILEAFGNAFTVHNANSSRFGKYTKMYFDRSVGLAGIELKTYLLEKTRVSHPAKTERNFHIFYQLIAGASEELKQKLCLKDISDYTILNSADQDWSQLTESDKSGYKQLLEHLQTLDFSVDDIEGIHKALAAILHLGNVRFGEVLPEKSTIEVSEPIETTPVETNQSEIPIISVVPISVLRGPMIHITSSPSLVNEEGDGVAYITNPEVLEMAANLLGVEPAALTAALTKLSLKSVQSAVLPLTKAKAELSRASLAQEIYERLFGWIIHRINETLEVEGDPDDCGYIAILDISGYETLNSNGFEQITINYTNDKLQQLYNELIYSEQEEYQKEFGWQPIEFDLDLQSVISVIESKPDGIFPTLDDVCYRQHASDAMFISELASYPVGTPRSNNKKSFQVIDENNLTFSVWHAPGPVEYCGYRFVIKNRDLLASSLETLMKNSNESLFRELFKEPTPKGQTSVAKFYLEQMEALMDAIRETDYSFIKCVKPNAQNAAGVIDKQYISEQIKWSGVVETLQICSRGLPCHFPYDKFVEKYSALSDVITAGEADRAAARKIIGQHLGSEPVSADFAFGKTKLYLSMAAVFKLDMLKQAKQDEPRDWMSLAKSAFGWLWNGSSQ